MYDFIRPVIIQPAYIYESHSLTQQHALALFYNHNTTNDMWPPCVL